MTFLYLQVNDQFLQFLMADNSDFLVVGVLGGQNVGKSTIMNLLARRRSENDKEDVFRVQSFEKQMMAEHCSNGITAWVITIIKDRNLKNSQV